MDNEMEPTRIHDLAETEKLFKKLSVTALNKDEHENVSDHEKRNPDDWARRVSYAEKEKNGVNSIGSSNSSQYEDVDETTNETETANQTKTSTDSVTETEPNNDSLKTNNSNPNLNSKKKKDPAYIPRTGYYFEHDSRDDPAEKDTVENPSDTLKPSTPNEPIDVVNNNQTQGKPNRRANFKSRNNASKKNFRSLDLIDKEIDDTDRWKHDRFDVTEQAPKSETEIIRRYGFNIRQAKDTQSIDAIEEKVPPSNNNRNQRRRRNQFKNSAFNSIDSDSKQGNNTNVSNNDQREYHNGYKQGRNRKANSMSNSVQNISNTGQYNERNEEERSGNRLRRPPQAFKSQSNQNFMDNNRQAQQQRNYVNQRNQDHDYQNQPKKNMNYNNRRQANNYRNNNTNDRNYNNQNKNNQNNNNQNNNNQSNNNQNNNNQSNNSQNNNNQSNNSQSNNNPNNNNPNNNNPNNNSQNNNSQNNNIQNGGETYSNTPRHNRNQNRQANNNITNSNDSTGQVNQVNEPPATYRPKHLQLEDSVTYNQPKINNTGKKMNHIDHRNKTNDMTNEQPSKRYSSIRNRPLNNFQNHNTTNNNNQTVHSQGMNNNYQPAGHPTQYIYQNRNYYDQVPMHHQVINMNQGNQQGGPHYYYVQAPLASNVEYQPQIGTQTQSGVEFNNFSNQVFYNQNQMIMPTHNSRHSKAIPIVNPSNHGY